MRNSGLDYYQVFYITGALYSAGVFAYHLLIRANARKAAVNAA